MEGSGGTVGMIVICLRCTRSSADWILLGKQKNHTTAIITTGWKAEVKASFIRRAGDEMLEKQHFSFPSLPPSLTIPLSVCGGSHSSRACVMEEEILPHSVANNKKQSFRDRLKDCRLGTAQTQPG